MKIIINLGVLEDKKIIIKIGLLEEIKEDLLWNKNHDNNTILPALPTLCYYPILL